MTRRGRARDVHVHSAAMLVARHLRSQTKALTRIDAAKPAWAAGIRGAIATIGPPIVMHLLGASGGSWIGLGGFLTTIADKGGAYRKRALLTMSTTIIGALAAAAGALLGADWRVALAATFLFVLLSNYARVWGPDAATVGSLVTVLFVVSLASPAHSLHDVIDRVSWLTIGGVFSMFLSLIAWPVRVFQPARRATADAFASLSAAAGSLGELARADSGNDVFLRFQQQCSGVRTSVENARATLGAIRRAGESSRGARLLVATEAADQIFGTLLMLGDDIDAWREAQASISLRQAERVAAGVALFCEKMAEFLVREFPARQAREAARRLVSSVRELETLRDQLASENADARLQLLLRRFVTYAEGIIENSERRDVVPSTTPRESMSLWRPIVDNFDRDSIVLRHALRAAVATSLAFAVATAMHLPRGYWMTLSVLVILQPYTDATVLKGLQRVVGTVAGGVLAALIGSAVHDPVILLGVIFVLTFTSLVLLPVNYTLYSLFLTPTFVLLAEVNAGDWHLVRVRIVNTLIGGAIALVAADILWPRSERKQLPAAVAAALRTNARYLEAIARLCGAPMSERHELRGHRRDVGLALINAETALERLLSEHGRDDTLGEAAAALTLYSRRLAISLASLSTAKVDAAPLRTFAARANDALEKIAQAVEKRSAPDEESFFNDNAIAQVAPYDRIARQIDVLRDAAQRAAM